MPRKQPRYDHPTRVARKLAALAIGLRSEAETPRKVPITGDEVRTRLTTWEEAAALVRDYLANVSAPIAALRTHDIEKPLLALIVDQQKWLAKGLLGRDPITAAELERRAALSERVETLIRTKR